MAKLFPITQQYLDLRDGVVIGIHKVEIVTTGSDFVVVGTSQDAAILNSTRTASDPTFYLTSNNSVFNIDGGTVGTQHIVVSRHGVGKINLIGSE